MAIWFHTAVLTTTLVATAAIGFAGAAVVSDRTELSAKSDRLSTDAPLAGKFVTVENRSAGVSVLTRIPVSFQ